MGAPATFQRVMDQVLNGLQDFTSAYLDDLIVFSTTWEHHVQHVDLVFNRLEEAGLTAKPVKCQFGETLQVLGACGWGWGGTHGTGQSGNCQRDETTKDKEGCTDIPRSYRLLQNSHTSITAPLSDLMRKKQPSTVQWTADAQVAFRQLKSILCASPVLQTPDFTKPFIVQTDASERGVRAVQSQDSEDGGDKPVAYFSRKLLPREEKYSTIEKECLYRHPLCYTCVPGLPDGGGAFTI